MKKVSAASIIAAASSLVGEQMHLAKEEVIMSSKRNKPYKYVSPNQYEAWFRKAFLRPRRKKV